MIVKREWNGDGCIMLLIPMVVGLLGLYFGIEVFEEHHNKYIIHFVICLTVFFLIFFKFESKPKNNSVRRIESYKSSLPETSDKLQNTTVENALDVENKESAYFRTAKTAARKLFEHIYRMGNNEEVIRAFQKYDQLAEAEKLTFNGIGINPRVGLTTLLDLFNCYKGLGYDLPLKGKEGLAFASLIMRFAEKDSGDGFAADDEQLLMNGGMDTTSKFIAGFSNCVYTNFPEDRYLTIYILRQEGINEDLIDKFVILLYRFVNIVAKADNVVNEKERDYLNHIMSFTTKDIKSDSKKGPKDCSHSDRESAQSNLNNLIGLDEVKAEVNKLMNFIKIQQIRHEKGLRTPPISCHCVFTGNPGTGKTTVARIMARLYKELGILKVGQLIETDRSGLIGEYVGQTAVKTNKIIDSALDGVLFIDEAYSLVQSDSNDYGMEAIATLLKRMEDDRDRLVVILAGYSDEMQQFLDSNPGLQSRFNRFIHFSDYNVDELTEIFMMNLRRNDYQISEEAISDLKSVFEQAVQHKDRKFGNGRYARNLYEKVIENQANRLSGETDLDTDKLSIILPCDIRCSSVM